MFTNYSRFILLIALLFSSISLAQTLSGVVLDEKTKEPLYGVSVYFDGTTNGTATDMQGKFVISYKASTESALVVSYLGYNTQIFDVRKLTSGVKIYLKSKPESLGVVFIENDPWPRKRKMAIFRREFIGKTVGASECRILNEDDIEVVFNPTTKKLTAYASKPILVKNKYLGYTISYNMEEFEAQLNVSRNGFTTTRSVYVEGTSFYSELRKKTRKRNLKAREKEYEESILHFMRSLAKKQLEENGFQIFHKGFIVPPYKYFDVTLEGENAKIDMKTNKLIIVYDRFHKSSLTIPYENKVFYINKFGNFSPPKKLSFGGFFGKKRIANTLPLDYNL
ncbi:carboxypeptidase-like regulatory domain-containing protein [uncultured Kordia sp.]|uniref:carboxypeptidase-like regulatory domain-containing protein n=1 Tax=uncultured Kordia sp. TaxID=507699 RepID=UPI002626EDBC|nr:carboxypeptidase-like regulatory domain-containing protein [uncultured Kordia sp.]